MCSWLTLKLFGLIFQRLEYLPCKQEVVGSNPTGSTIPSSWSTRFLPGLKNKTVLLKTPFSNHTYMIFKFLIKRNCYESGSLVLCDCSQDGLRRRTATPLCTGSNPVSRSNSRKERIYGLVLAEKGNT